MKSLTDGLKIGNVAARFWALRSRRESGAGHAELGSDAKRL